MNLNKKLFPHKVKDHEKNINRNNLALREIKTLKYLLNKKYNYDIEKYSNLKILDLGCADKYLQKPTEDLKIEYHGLDINNVDLENQKIPYGNDYFDLVICLALIEHISKPDNFYSEVYRVLKKKGIIYLITPNWKYSYKDFYNDPTHVKPYTAESLMKCLDMYGFNDIEVLPGLRCKNIWWYSGKLRFFKGRYLLPFLNSENKTIPNFLKGKSKSIIAIARK